MLTVVLRSENEMEHFFACLGRAVDVVKIQSGFFLMAHINTVDDATMEFHSNVFLISKENIFCLFIEDGVEILHVLLAIIVAYHAVGPNQSVAAYAGAILLGEFLGFSLEPLAFGFLTGTEKAKSAQKEEGVENRFLHFLCDCYSVFNSVAKIGGAHLPIGLGRRWVSYHIGCLPTF